MHIGVDFDNTIVCYDSAFHGIALAAGLIPESLPRDKTSVRDHLRAIGKEDRWTAFQGLIYGERITDAQPFPGVLDFFAACAANGVRCSIVSHRTRQPIVGAPHDLHAAARRWLETNRVTDFISPNAIFFEEKRTEKAARVASLQCTHFIDDLPEFLSEPGLPSGLHRIHFDPARVGPGKHPAFPPAHSWAEIRALFSL